MTFNEGIRTDPNRVKTSRATKGGAIGGIGGIVLLLIFMFTGQDFSGMLGGQSTAESSGMDLSHCTTGEAANLYDECRMVATAESLDAMWDATLVEQTGVQYVMPSFTVFQGSVNTACGQATSAVGPFYCPADQGVYLDIEFFQVLETQLGAENAPLAQMYIVAHEWGHHIQNQLGYMDQVDSQQTGATSGAVRLELQADCLAGMWVRYGSSTIDPESGQTFLQPPTEEELRSALVAAGAVGDDRIQERTQGRAIPETFSHGTSEQRMRWFATGFDGGTVQSCDTFAIPGSQL
ncbi:MAG TPA: neutral zinc metallopeptidase [Actinomycetaceae bacterium]|nr:neutral zinc metallopeptidase [Actinomycetaceae bacterium]